MQILANDTYYSLPGCLAYYYDLAVLVFRAQMIIVLPFFQFILLMMSLKDQIILVHLYRISQI